MTSTSSLITSLLSLCFLFTLGCASLSQQGYKALEAGQYEKALTLFEKAHQNDPKDGEAKEGLSSTI